jgi:hypothetical protein
MARMIPPSCSTKTPAGEKDLFNKLRDDPDTEGWVVLHSLDLKRHQSKIEGELDMVILVPSLGVLCVEVKGCDVSRQDGKWIYPYETSVEGPFKQASKAMHSLRTYLVNHDCSLSGLIFFSAVVFTRVDFDELSPEWHPWQYVNRRLLVRRPISLNISTVLQRAHEHVASRVGRYSWYNDADSRPSEGQIRRMVALLRDNFEYAVSPRSDLKQLEQMICRFTEEQFDALDLLAENHRVVFKGPAGTGKTLLAMEATRRAVEDGKTVLLLCYNSLLGDWLKAKTSSYSDDSAQIRCSTFHSLLLEIACEKAGKAAGNEYWRKELPVRASDRLLDDKRPWPAYDMLVIDEAQDLLEDEYLDVLDLLVKGGLAGGKWAFFGDFERQAIYVSAGGEGAMQGLEGLSDRAPRHVKSSLRINCRNAEPIAETLAITSGLVPGYKRVLHDIEGSDVDLLFHASTDAQELHLAEAIRNLRETFKAGEIVVLSMRGDESSCAGTASAGAIGARLVPIRQVQDGQAIPFATIHAFKGLEAPAVIITDIENLNDEKTRALLYVGMSRARIRLYMLMNERCRGSYDRILDAGLAISSRK